ncbi:MAG: TonB-dependent receptor [Saprospiraceae bacterium]|nr:TonB-dependent receptor [Saprospiraceae bacterium]
MFRFIFTSLSILIGSIVYGQKISGILIDENKNPLEYASVVLMTVEDSTMIAFTNSNRKGEYTLDVNKPGKYLIQISFLGYETVHKQLELTEKDMVMDNIHLKPGNQMLDVIEIKDYASPITFGKDTIQYNASAFKIQPGDMVEDLLKKLPGVEVQRDGTVKALGEKVENVFVDGKEFFGKDTKIATKNLDADAVDKVQVFDRRSDGTEFTGIDDGQRERSINLKLKDDKKTGYFGTTEVFAGTKERFKGRANINRFKPGLRTSFIGLANNINEQNFSFNEYVDFMGGIGALMGGGGGGRFIINTDEIGGVPISPTENQGIQKSYAGGLNFNKDYSSTSTLETSVFGNHFNNDLNRSSSRENLLPDNRFFTNSDEIQNSKSTAGSFTLRYKTKSDSFQNLVLRANGSLGMNDLFSYEENNIKNNLQVKQNDNINDYNRNGSSQSINSSILWQLKTRKHGRTLSVNGSGGYSNNNSTANLTTLYNFFFPQPEENKIIQDQLAHNNGFNYRAEVSYTEPVKRKTYLEWKVSVADQTNKTSSDYFDIVNENPVRNYVLSNQFQRDYVQRNVGLNYIVSRQKYNLTVGARYKNSTLTGRITDSANKVKNNFDAILPNAFLNYRFGVSENLNIDYSSELNEPSLQQLQPLVNNTNPLAIYIGNPQLRPEQMHNLNMSYMNYNAFNFTLFYASLGANYTHNKISEALSIDSSLARIYTPKNIRNEATSYGKVEYETPIRPLKIKTRLVLRSNVNRGYSVINNIENPIMRFGYDYNFSIENRNKDLIDVFVGYKSNHSESIFKNDKTLNQSFVQNTLYAELGISIKDWVNVKSRYDYSIIKSSFSESAIEYPLWTASVTSYITKNKRLRATISCYDVLNQNKGIRTSSNLNYTDVTLSNVLNRYFLFGLSYNIKGFKKKNDFEIQINSDR